MGGVSTASTAQAAQPVLKMRIASSSNSNASINGAFVWLRAFMDSADADGIKTVFYPGSALGKEAERTELVNLGLIQLNMIGLSELQIYSAAARAFSIPFMIDGYQQLENLLLETDFLPSLNEELSKTNLMVVDLAILGGMSGLFTTRKPVLPLRYEGTSLARHGRRRDHHDQQLGKLKRAGRVGGSAASTGDWHCRGIPQPAPRADYVRTS